MSLIDRINGLIMSRLRRNRPGPALAGDALRLGDEVFPLAALTGVVAYEADVYAGAVIALALVFGDGRSLTVSQEDACWTGFLAALDRLGLTERPSRDWLTAMIAGEGRATPLVLRGGVSGPT